MGSTMQRAPVRTIEDAEMTARGALYEHLYQAAMFAHRALIALVGSAEADEALEQSRRAVGRRIGGD